MLPAEKYNIRDLADEWHNICLSAINERTANQQFSMVRQFLWKNHISRLGQINSLVIQKHLTNLLLNDEYAPSTIRGAYSSISSFCKYLTQVGMFFTTPCRDIRLPKVYLPDVEYLNESEIKKIFAIAEYYHLGFEVYFAVHTGMRRCELRVSQFEHVDWDSRIIRVRGKGHKKRTIPLADVLFDKLKMLDIISGYIFPSSHSGPRGVNTWTRSLGPIQAKMPKVSGWHIFRHTFASILAQQGVSIAKIAQWLGHSKIQLTVDYYANLSPDRYDEDINRLSI